LLLTCLICLLPSFAIRALDCLAQFTRRGGRKLSALRVQCFALTPFQRSSWNVPINEVIHLRETLKR
jgi:hypothetical protein